MKKIQIIMTIVFFIAICFFYESIVYAVPFVPTECDSSNVSGSVDCQIGLGNNDTLAPSLSVNDETFFGFSDWQYLNKDEEGVNVIGSAFGWIVTAAGGSFPDDEGDWFFDGSVWDNYGDVMLVLKAGPNFIGYLLDNISQPTAGSWSTADLDYKVLSHLTLYARGGDKTVPEPATMILLGTGLIGLAGLYKGRKKK